MDTKQLLEKATEKLSETKISFEEDKEKLSELIEIRGNELAGEMIETRPERVKKIKKLTSAIAILRTTVADTPTIVNGLKRVKLKLASQKEKEDKVEAKKGQVKLETSLNETASKLVGLLKQVVALNSKLKTDWADWDKLDSISGKGLTDKKCIRPSQDMLDKVCETLLSEWLGQSNGEVRRFYARDNYRNTHLIF